MRGFPLGVNSIWDASLWGVNPGPLLGRDLKRRSQAGNKDAEPKYARNVHGVLPIADYHWLLGSVVGAKSAASVWATEKSISARSLLDVGIKEVHDDIWLLSFMDYDLGYFDLETRVLEPLGNPFGPKVSPM